MMKKRYGRIINITSVIGQLGNPDSQLRRGQGRAHRIHHVRGA
jgi:hypothetical protein